MVQTHPTAGGAAPEQCPGGFCLRAQGSGCKKLQIRMRRLKKTILNSSETSEGGAADKKDPLDSSYRSFSTVRAANPEIFRKNRRKTKERSGLHIPRPIKPQPRQADRNLSRLQKGRVVLAPGSEADRDGPTNHLLILLLLHVLKANSSLSRKGAYAISRPDTRYHDSANGEARYTRVRRVERTTNKIHQLCKAVLRRRSCASPQHCPLNNGRSRRKGMSPPNRGAGNTQATTGNDRGSEKKQNIGNFWSLGDRKSSERGGGKSEWGRKTSRGRHKDSCYLPKLLHRGCGFRDAEPTQ